MSHGIPSTVRDAERRSRCAWFDDGIPDLVGGITLVAFAGWTFVRDALDVSSLWSLPLLAALIFGVKRAQSWLKGRISDQRTGYIRLQQQRLDARGWLLLGGLLIAVTVVQFAVFIFNLAPIPATPPSGGFDPWRDAWYGPVLAFSGALAFAAWRSGVPRYLLMAAIPWLVAAVALPAGLTKRPALALLTGSVGTALLASGAISLARYLRRYPLDHSGLNRPTNNGAGG